MTVFQTEDARFPCCYHPAGSDARGISPAGNPAASCRASRPALQVSRNNFVMIHEWQERRGPGRCEVTDRLGTAFRQVDRLGTEWGES